MYENLDKSELREAYGSSEDKYTVQTCVLCILYEANDLAYWLVNDRAYWLVNDRAYWLVNDLAYWLVNDLAYWLVNDLAYWLANDLAYWLVNDRAYWLVNDRAYWPCRLARSQHTVSLSGTMKSGKSFGSVGV